MEEYRPNSHRSKDDASEKKIASVVSGKVEKKKKSGIAKLADIFVPDDIDSVRSYIVESVIVPLAKKAIEDTIHTILYGDAEPPKKTRASSVSYSGYFEKEKRSSSRAAEKSSRYFDDLTFESRADAEEVIEQLDELIECYGVVSVADLYDLVGFQNGSHTDNKFGWVDLRSARIVRTWDGDYMLKLPKAVPIN